jgi:HlyD family secretion protein
VPNAAFRWTPSVEQVAPEYRDGPPAGEAPPPAGTGVKDGDTTRWGVVYAIAGQYVRPVPVKVGLSSGSYSEVAGEGLAEGMEVVMGMEAAAAAATAETSNPFTPKLPRPPKGGPPPP